MNKNCVTHHYACDCREEKFKKLEQQLVEAQKLVESFRLMCNGLKKVNKSVDLITSETADQNIDYILLKINDFLKNIKVRDE